MTDEPKRHFKTIGQAAEELNVKASLIRNLIKRARGRWGTGKLEEGIEAV